MYEISTENFENALNSIIIKIKRETLMVFFKGGL